MVGGLKVLLLVTEYISSCFYALRTNFQVHIGGCQLHVGGEEVGVRNEVQSVPVRRQRDAVAEEFCVLWGVRHRAVSSASASAFAGALDHPRTSAFPLLPNGTPGPRINPHAYYDRHGSNVSH